MLLIGVLATALFSIVGLLGTPMVALRNDVRRLVERVADQQGDIAELRAEFRELRGELRSHIADHAV